MATQSPTPRPLAPLIRARTEARIREFLGHAPREEMIDWKAPQRAALAGHVVVASYNIHKCVGTDGRFDPGRIAEVIGELQADVIALQEADRRFRVRSGLLDSGALRARSELTFLPLSPVADGHGWHGNALLVRGGTTTRLERLELPCAEPRGAVLAEMLLPQGPLRIIAAHLGLLRNSRRRQAEALLEVIERSERMPTLLVGDLNEWRPGQPRSPLAALERLFGPAPPSPPSFPARRPLFTLDRILGWPQGLVSALAVHDSPLARVASDHLPLKALVNLQAGRHAAAHADGRA